MSTQVSVYRAGAELTSGGETGPGGSSTVEPQVKRPLRPRLWPGEGSEAAPGR